jgi:hypothetical protein
LDVVLCAMVNRYWHFGGACCLHLQGRKANHAGRRGMQCRWERPKTGAVQTIRYTGGPMKGSLLTEKRKPAVFPLVCWQPQPLLLYATYSSPFSDGGCRASGMLVFIYQSAWCQILDVSKRCNQG